MFPVGTVYKLNEILNKKLNEFILFLKTCNFNFKKMETFMLPVFSNFELASKNVKQFSFQSSDSTHRINFFLETIMLSNA